MKSVLMKAVICLKKFRFRLGKIEQINQLYKKDKLTILDLKNVITSLFYAIRGMMISPSKKEKGGKNHGIYN